MEILLLIVFIILLFIIFKPKQTFIENAKRLKILFITAENRDDKYIEDHDQNLRNYCNKHGYTYLRTDNCPKSVSTTYWCKIHLVKENLDKGIYDYVVWLDSDTVITDYSKPLEYFINKYKKDIIIGNDCHVINTRKDINAGAFVIKNSDIGRNFINDCLLTLKSKPECIVDDQEQGEWAGECYEQGVMNQLRNGEYHDYIYVDEEKEFIYNDCFGSVYEDLIEGNLLKEIDMPFIVHLCYIDNNDRSDFFKKYI